MTPAQYARVRDVFTRALEVSPDERRKFVETECGGDTQISDEVFSLLTHHAEETILETHVQQPLGAEEATPLDTQTPEPTESTIVAAPSRIQVEARSETNPYLVLRDVWNDSRHVLRRRLTIIAAVLAALILLSSVRLFTYEYMIWGYGVRVGAFATCLLCAVILQKFRDLTLTEIRIIEWIVMATVIVFIIVVDVRLMLDVADEEGAAATMVAINDWFFFAWTLLIFVYGVFMPNNWKRASAILVPVAAIPYVVVAAVGRLEPAVPALLSEDRFGQPIPITFVATAISIFAAHLIHGARVSAFQARRLAQYRLKRLIGEGGMGQVFEAEHVLLKRDCAVKLIRPEFCAEDQAVKRFEREVRATAKLTHPNTIEIYDYGQTSQGEFFFAMELLPGLNLQALVSNYGPLPPSRMIYLLKQVCRALSEAHDFGLFHRDIKPANIFATQRGGIQDVAKLLDFGVVRQQHLDPGISRTGAQVVGTPSFMSPEQIMTPGEIDERSDLYAIGAVAYYLLAGKPPFTGGTPMEVILAQLNRSPVPLAEQTPSVPDDVEAVVTQCLQKPVDLRPANARELLQKLQDCDCNDLWTEEDARRWWLEHQAAIQTKQLEAGRVITPLEATRHDSVISGSAEL